MGIPGGFMRLAAAAAAAAFLAATAALAAWVADRPEVAAAENVVPPGPVALRHDPQFILAAVAWRMGIVLRPDVPVPAIRLESRTPVERFQAAAERQWGFRPERFTTTYASASNEIFLIDDGALYAKYGRTPDDSLAHEFVHYLQAAYLRDGFTTDWAESEAVAIQEWFRKAFIEPDGGRAVAQANGGR